MVGSSSSSPSQIPRVTSPALPVVQQVAAPKKVDFRVAVREIPTSRPGKEVELEDLNIPYVLSGAGGEGTCPKQDGIPPMVGMSWSP
jgi:hypothetical protein